MKTMRRTYLILALAGAFVLPCLQSQNGQPEQRTWKLLEIRIRDPFILPDEATRTYYLYRSGGAKAGVLAYASTDLENWNGPFQVFRMPDGFWGNRTIWAPEVHHYRGKYYLFATFNSLEKVKSARPDWQPAERYPLVARGTQILVSDSPKGPFQPFRNQAHTPADWMSLDGTLWVEDGVPWMVFCHEWVQMQDGTMELMRLKTDLSAAAGKPVTLFRASDAPWRRNQEDRDPKTRSWVTDGPFLYRTKGGNLLMTWSSFGAGGYTVGLAVSKSGKVAGPWSQVEQPLFKEDGGHAMIFKTFDNRLMLVLHQPNSKAERARLLELEDTGDSIRRKD